MPVEFGHFESAEIPLRSAFSRHFVAHFVETNQSAAVKGAVYLDLGVERTFLVETEATAGKEMLRRISAMVAGF